MHSAQGCGGAADFADGLGCLGPGGSASVLSKGKKAVVLYCRRVYGFMMIYDDFCMLRDMFDWFPPFFEKPSGTNDNLCMDLFFGTWYHIFLRTCIADCLASYLSLALFGWSNELVETRLILVMISMPFGPHISFLHDRRLYYD